MFRAIGKFIKWFLIISVAMFVVFIAYHLIVDPDKEAREECYATHGEIYCDSSGKVGDKEAIDNNIERERIAEAEVAEKIARDERLAAAREKIAKEQALVEARIDGKLTAGRLMCKNSVRKLAKYPTKVDYEGWTEGNIVENFTNGGKYPDRFWINFEGEWMNGYGNMVPFTAHCKLDINPTTGKIVDIWIN